MGGFCVRDDKDFISMHQILKQSLHVLKEKRGEVECGWRDSPFWPLDFLERQVKSKVFFRDEAEWGFLWRNAVEEMKLSPLFLVDLENMSVASKHYVLPRLYMVKNELLTWRFFLISSLSVLFLLYLVHKIRGIELDRYERLDSLNSDVIKFLSARKKEWKEKHASYPWIPVESVKKIVCPKLWSEDWPIVEERISEHPKVIDAYKKVNGELRRIWEWKVTP